jgi:transcriptional regulator with XRE-family HTH domain
MPAPKLGRPSPLDADLYVGARVRERRITIGMSQEQLAALVGVTYQQMHKYERGINRISVGRLWALSLALAVDVSFFFEGLGSSVVRLPTTRQSRQTQNLVENVAQLSEREREAVYQLANTLRLASDDERHSQGGGR